MAGAAVAQWLAGAAARLRRAAPAMGLTTPAEMGAAFIDAVNQGLVTANPPDWGEPPDPEGVVLSTLYAYLLAGQPARLGGLTIGTFHSICARILRVETAAAGQ